MATYYLFFEIVHRHHHHHTSPLHWKVRHIVHPPFWYTDCSNRRDLWRFSHWSNILGSRRNQTKYFRNLLQFSTSDFRNILDQLKFIFLILLTMQLSTLHSPMQLDPAIKFMWMLTIKRKSARLIKPWTKKYLILPQM